MLSDSQRRHEHICPGAWVDFAGCEDSDERASVDEPTIALVDHVSDGADALVYVFETDLLVTSSEIWSITN